MSIDITGIGIVSAIGNDLASNFQSLQQGKSGIEKSAEHQLYLGNVKLSNEKLRTILNIHNIHTSRTSLIGQWAIKEAWGTNSLTPKIRTGLVSSTSVGSMDITEKFYLESYPSSPPLHYSLMNHENGLITEEIAKSIGFNGFMTTISTACSSGANAIAYGAELIKASMLDRVIVGGVDAITLFNIKGFSSLNIYDPEPCRPFSDSRIGLNIGEGAAFLILENDKSREITGNSSWGKLIGWNNSSDAHHQTASSEDGYGAYLSMTKTLEMANASPSQIDYINMHGTGTPNNDHSESNAVLKLFGNNLPPFSSTKPYTGHTLAAAGAIEAVFSLLAMQNQCLFPNLNYSGSNTYGGLKPVVKFTPNHSIENVLSNSFGFGGNCSSILFSKK